MYLFNITSILYYVLILWAYKTRLMLGMLNYYNVYSIYSIPWLIFKAFSAIVLLLPSLNMLGSYLTAGIHYYYFYLFSQYLPPAPFVSHEGQRSIRYQEILLARFWKNPISDAMCSLFYSEYLNDAHISLFSFKNILCLLELVCYYKE